MLGFPCVGLARNMDFGVFVTGFDFNEEELEIILNMNKSQDERMGVITEVVVPQSVGSICILLFITVGMSLSCIACIENRFEFSPYEKDMHFWFDIISRIGTITIILLGMAYDITAGDIQIVAAVFMTLLGAAALISVAVVCGWYGLFSTPFIYHYMLKAYCLPQLSKAYTQEQVDVFLEENENNIMKITIENWAYLTPAQRLYAVSKISYCD